MRYFHRLAQGDNFINLLHSVVRQGDLWNQEKLRTSDHPDHNVFSPHKQVDDILVRFQDLARWKKELADRSVILDEHESIWQPAAMRLPSLKALAFTMMGLVQGERLGRIIVTRLAPGGVIEPHVDGGDHAAYYDRYHCVLQGLPGSIFRCGGEEVQMLSGETWWFDNSQEHSVINNSADDRIHVIIDIRTTR